jgi:hypothetical protein
MNAHRSAPPPDAVMHRSLTPLLLRGLLGTALSVAAVAAAATQAARFEGEVRLDQGRLVLLQLPPSDAQCTLPAPESTLASFTPG